MTRRFLVVLALLLAHPALAQTDVRERAKEHYRKGKALQDAGKHGDAIAEYQAAYQLAPLPGMLFNLGQAYRLHGDRAHAMEHYQKYLAVEPNGQGSAEARLHLDAFRAAIRSEEEAARRKAAEDEAARRKAAEEEAVRKAAEEAAARRAAEEAAVRKAAEEAAARKAAEEAARRRDAIDARNRTGRGLRIGGLVAGGAGVVLLGGGVYFALRAKSMAAEIEDASGVWTPEIDDKARHAGPAAERNMIIAGAAGIVCVGVGSYLYIRGVRARSEAWARGGAIALTPVLAPGHAGLALLGRF